MAMLATFLFLAGPAVAGKGEYIGNDTCKDCHKADAGPTKCNDCHKK